MNFVEEIKAAVIQIFQDDFSVSIPADIINLGETKKEFKGDTTMVVFPLIKFSKKSPEQTAEIIGNKLKEQLSFIQEFNVVKGFLNIVFTDAFWIKQLEIINEKGLFTLVKGEQKAEKVLLEYCGPNTNKPLHIGHLRNMFLGFSMGEILKAYGAEVIKVNIYNDRGIAICKSMAAYLSHGANTTPESAGIKGDHFVGDYYVEFSKIVNEQLREKYKVPVDETNIFNFLQKEREVAEQETKIFQKAKDLLLKWEANDEETLRLWNQMNGWVYKGFKETFDVLGIDFQKDYFESETYKLGKNVIDEGLQKNIFYKRTDGAVAVDLKPDGLDEKVLLRSDGTSIYITQDLGTAVQRQEEFHFDKMIYVVANEQDYHFKVLRLALQKLGKKWADGIYHLSYGMVESPTGRFKSREGNTADADDLVKEVLQIAEERTKELGKTEGFTIDETKTLYKTIGLGALKYFILRVNPYKRMIFNPEESIDFHGQTGPFIQYTYARIRSIIRKVESTENLDFADYRHLENSERELVIMLSNFPVALKNAATQYDPSEISSYVYNLAKQYNKFYSECSVINAPNLSAKNFRIILSKIVADSIKESMLLLGINVPERM